MDEIQNLQHKLNAAEEALITAQDEHARAEESRIAAEVILPSLLSGCMGILTYCVPFYIFSAITVIDQVFWEITAQWTRLLVQVALGTAPNIWLSSHSANVKQWRILRTDGTQEDPECLGELLSKCYTYGNHAPQMS